MPSASEALQGFKTLEGLFLNFGYMQYNIQKPTA